MALTDSDRQLVHMIAREVTQETADKISDRLEETVQRLTMQRDRRVGEMIAHHASTCGTVHVVADVTAWSSGVWFIVCGLASMVGSGVTLAVVLAIRLWT